MKTVLITVVVLVLSSSVYAADSSGIAPKGFLEEVKTLATQCAVIPYAISNGVETQGQAKSICPELSVSGSTLNFTVQGVSYVATVQDSADSDGGDLNDLQVVDSQGKVILQRSNVLAFGDVIQALVGTQVQLKKVYDRSVLEVSPSN